MRFQAPSVSSHRRVLAGSIAAAVLACFSTATAEAGLLYWDTNDVADGTGAATGNWGLDPFWTTDPLGQTSGSAYIAGSDVIFSAGTNGTGGTVTVLDTQVVNSITFKDNAALNLSGGTGLVLGGTTGQGIFVTSNVASANTISTVIVLDPNAAPTMQNSGTAALTLGNITGGAVSGTQMINFSLPSTGTIVDAGIIADGLSGGKVGLTVSGTGTGSVNLSGASTFTGGVNLNSGTLRMGANGALGAATNVVTMNGGTLLGGAVLTVSQPINFGANGGTISTVGAAGKIILSGALSGSGTFTRAGNFVTAFSSGTTNDLQITIANTGFTGAIVMNGGVIEMGTNSLGNGSAGTNKITVNAGAELVSNLSIVALPITVNGNAILTGNGTGAKEFSGAMTTSGNFKVRLGEFHQAVARNLTISSAMNGSGVFTMISSAGAVASGQNLVISGNNTAYSGRFTAAPGYSMIFNTANSLGTGGLSVVSTGGQLGAIGFAYDFGASVPAFTNTRVGSNTTTGSVFGVNAVLANTTTLDLSTLGGGGMFLGTAANTGTYSANTLGADAGVYRLGGGGGTLTLNGTNALTGAANLVVNDPRTNGGGTVVLAGATNYTGTTQVNAGTLSLNYSAGTAPTDNIISSGSALTMRGGNLTLTGRSGGPSSQAFAGTTVSGAATTTLTPNGSNVIRADYGAITRSSSGIFTSSTSSTATAAATTGAIATTTNTNSLSTSLLGTWMFTGSGVNTRYATRDDSQAVQGQVVGLLGSTLTDATGLTDTTGTANYNLPVATGTVTSPFYGNTIRYTGTVAATTTQGASFQVNGLLNAGTAGTAAWTISGGALTIGGDKELVVNAASAGITIGSVIADNAVGVASAVTVTGGNAVTLSAVNTFTGGLNVIGGTVSFPGNTTANTNLGAAGKPIFLNGGVLSSTAAAGSPAIDHPIVIGPNGGTIATAGTGTAGKISMNASLLTGTGTFTHTGASDLQMTGAASTFSGQFNVSGLVEASLTGALGTGVVSINNGGELSVGGSGVLLTNPFVFTGGTLSAINSSITIPASTTITATGDFQLATRAFNTTTNVWGITLAAPISGNGSLAAVVVGTNATNNRQIILLSGNNVNWNGNVSTQGASTTNGITLRLGNANALGSSLGYTTIAPNSTLDLNGITLANAEPLTIGGTGPLAFATALTNESATSAVFSGPITLTANTSMGSTGGGNFTLSGTITGAFGITKGLGPSQALILSGNSASTYTGPTSVTSGFLSVSGSIAGSAVTASGAGTLTGSGTTGAITITTGGTLAPGAGIGTLTANGGLSITGTGTLSAEINTTTLTADLLNASGGLTLDPANTATLLLTDFGGNAMPLGSVLTLIDYNGAWNGGIFAGHPDDSTFNLGVNQFRISYDGAGGDTAVTLTAVPEPAAALVLLSGVGILFGLRRRRTA